MFLYFICNSGNAPSEQGQDGDNTMAFNLSETGEQLGGFLTALQDPLPQFILAMGLAIAIISLVMAIVYVIKKTVEKFGSGK